MGHLYRITQHESENQMSISNISIVFGPTLLNGPPGTMSMANGAGQAGNGQVNGMGAANAAHIGDNAHWQNKAIETVLEHYVDIFVDDAETGA